MSYRKIVIKDIEYQYTIGKKFTKIVNVGIFDNSVIGTEIISQSGSIRGYSVSPKNVKNAILGIKEKPLFRCHHGTVTDKLMVNPFQAEIYDKTVFIAACKTCYENLSDEI